MVKTVRACSCVLPIKGKILGRSMFPLLKGISKGEERRKRREWLTSKNQPRIQNPRVDRPRRCLPLARTAAAYQLRMRAVRS